MTRPALKKADIGIAMGITGTEVTKEAAVMILTDDNFSTIVKAVELGRGLYDNLTKYIRFQMGCLFGFIVSFLGASIFDITGGVPFLPLQTLWINFTTLLFQAIGLGYGQPAPGLMERQPRQPDQPILTRGRFAWLITVGLVMGAGTLGVISWAEQVHTEAIAHTMGVVTFSLYALFFSIATRDERRTVFSLDTFSDSKFVIATGVSILTLLLSTVFGPLETFLKTTSLDVRQWLICIGAALSIVVVSEIRKALRRRTAAKTAPAGDHPRKGDDTLRRRGKGWEPPEKTGEQKTGACYLRAARGEPGMRIVIALGGNALLRRGEPMTTEVQRRNIKVAADAIAPLAAGHSIVVVHGNGPQVGLLALQADSYQGAEPYPLDVLDAGTQGMIGYLIQQELRSLLPPDSRWRRCSP